MSNYTYIVNGDTYSDEQIRTITNSYLNFHFGLLRIGTTVYNSQWIDVYHCAYLPESTHPTEAAADLRITELITKRMQTMSKPELEYTDIMRRWDNEKRSSQ